MHRVKFYPVGNGDTCQIILDNGKRLLLDYRHKKESDAEDSKLFNLRTTLKKELKDAKRDYFDVVAFTHADLDHISFSTEFFELWYAQKYQGGDRTKIKELWVPAAMILEPVAQEKMDSELYIWRQEARHRLKEGKGIRVFSKPEMLKDWFEKAEVDFDSRRHLITDAGSLVPGFTLQTDQVEFFCHSPFVKHVEGGDILRNEASLIFQVRFEVNGTRYDFLAVGDTTHEVLEEIVYITEYHKRADRLDWDLYNIPHHCSYLALGPEKGKIETKPVGNVEKLLRHGQRGAYIVSSSHPILDTPEAHQQELPPHIQAKRTYKKYLAEVDGRKFMVTMEEPNVDRPQPIVFEIGPLGGKLLSAAPAGAAAVVSSVAPRAGLSAPVPRAR